MRKIFYLGLFLIISCGGDIASDNVSSNSSGLYTAPVLAGDYIEKPVASIILSSSSFNEISHTLIDLSPNLSAFVEAKGQPVANDKASFFEVTSMQKKSFSTITSCHTNLPFGACSSSFTYKPYCNGADFTYIKLQADKSAPVILTVTGNGDGFIDNCSKYKLDNITLTSENTSHRFTYIGEIFHWTAKADKEIPSDFSYSTNGALNGFYYSYSCFSSDNTCSGFAQFLGKVGKYECHGETTISFNIYADPFSTKGHTPITITLYGAGTGRDEAYPCQLK